VFKKFIVTFLFSILFISQSYAKEITLHMASIEDSPKLHLYFHELLQTALLEDGQDVKLITEELPQLRVKYYLDNGVTTIYWLLQSQERDEKYIPIKIGLTEGLIGKRILLIKRGNQHIFDKVKTLEDFRDLNLVAPIAKKWFDIKVWEENDLTYSEHKGSWKTIFKTLSHRTGYDYFSRGLNEIGVEVKEYPLLEIEKRLVLIYDRDFIFYLSKEGPNSGAKYKDIIEHALTKAKESGLIKRLVKKYWASDFEELDYDNRIKLYLKTPK